MLSSRLQIIVIITNTLMFLLEHLDFIARITNNMNKIRCTIINKIKNFHQKNGLNKSKSKHSS